MLRKCKTMGSYKFVEERKSFKVDLVQDDVLYGNSNFLVI